MMYQILTSAIAPGRGPGTQRDRFLRFRWFVEPLTIKCASLQPGVVGRVLDFYLRPAVRGVAPLSALRGMYALLPGTTKACDPLAPQDRTTGFRPLTLFRAQGDYSSSAARLRRAPPRRSPVLFISAPRAQRTRPTAVVRRADAASAFHCRVSRSIPRCREPRGSPRLARGTFFTERTPSHRANSRTRCSEVPSRTGKITERTEREPAIGPIAVRSDWDRIGRIAKRTGCGSGQHRSEDQCQHQEAVGAVVRGTHWLRGQTW